MFSGSAIVGAVCLSLFIHVNDGLPNRFGSDVDITISLADRAAYVVKRQEAAQRVRAFVPDGSVKVLVIGDSFSQHFINVLSESIPPSELQLASYFVPNICQIYFADPQSDEGMKQQPTLYDSEREVEWPLLQSADVVFLASMWQNWSAVALPVTIAALEARGAKRIEVVGSKSFGNFNRSALLHVPSADRPTMTVAAPLHLMVTNPLVETAVGASRFVDVHAAITGWKDGLRAPLFDTSGRLLSHDGAHLTKAGVQVLADRLGPTLKRRLASVRNGVQHTP